jgi:hypothetical protein
MAANDHLVILAASAAGMHRNQVLSGRQIKTLHPYLPHLSPIANTESVVLPTLFPSIGKWI